MKYGLIGAKLGHSFSPSIHKKIGDYEYTLAELTEAELDEFLTKKEFCGVNVTIPYKQTVIKYLDEIDEAAKSIGAVNVIVNRSGRLCGYNTDYDGAAALIRRAGVEINGKNVLILGTGGTSKTLNAVATGMDAKKITHASRHSGAGTVSYDEALTLSDTQVIINTTPVGMYPNIDGCPIDSGAFDCLEGVIDVVYNPIATPLVRLARARGIKAEGGLYMLAAQAVYASALFRGVSVDDALTEKVYNGVRCEKQNIVLVGMPSSGKTTVGRLLAGRLNRRFIDTDVEIVHRLGKPIPEIFAESGEAYFREQERKTIADLTKEQGIVIATGGGSVLNSENVFDLKANGLVFYLDRPLEKLISTKDRPLASDRAALEMLYTERRDKYQRAADIVIAAGGGADAVADLVLEEFAK